MLLIFKPHPNLWRKFPKTITTGNGSVLWDPAHRKNTLAFQPFLIGTAQRAIYRLLHNNLLHVPVVWFYERERERERERETYNVLCMCPWLDLFHDWRCPHLRTTAKGEGLLNECSPHFYCTSGIKYTVYRIVGKNIRILSRQKAM